MSVNKQEAVCNRSATNK